MPIWDEPSAHISAARRQLVGGRAWLRSSGFRPGAPELSPTEDVWSPAETQLGDLAATMVDHLAPIVRNRLERI